MTLKTAVSNCNNDQHNMKQRLSFKRPALLVVLITALVTTGSAKTLYSNRVFATAFQMKPLKVLSRTTKNNGDDFKNFIILPLECNKEDYPPERAKRSGDTTTNINVISQKRKKKHKNRKKMKVRKGSHLTEDDLATHVSSRYVYGPGGILKQAEKKRNRQEASRMFLDGNKDQVEVLKRLDRHPALVLNADYQPLSVLPLSLWSWQDTVKALFSGKVTVVDVYPGITIRAVNMDVPLPSVIALTEYVPQPKQVPAFTRRNVFLRDGYQCQYCAKSYRTNDLSLDHVIPRCRGGVLEWENTVTCCKKCNGRKGSTMPSELRRIGMKLLREPRSPSKYELASVATRLVPRKGVHPTWNPYLGLETKPEEKDTSFFENESRNFLMMNDELQENEKL